MPSQNHSKIISYVIVAIIMAVCTILIWTVTCTANATNEPIKLGVKVWAPDFFSYLAQEKGFFDRNKVKVELNWYRTTNRFSIIMLTETMMA